MNILIIDDNEVARRHLFWALRKNHDLHEAATREEALQNLSRVTPDAVLMELLEEQDTDESAGIALVEQLLGEAHPPSIIIITRSERKEVASRLLRKGVVDVFTKPVRPEEIQMVLGRVERLRELERVAPEADPPSAKPSPKSLRGAAAVGQGGSPLGVLGVVGVDRRMQHLMEQVRRIAPTPVSVLITGETGTGKEVFAQAIHTLSDRARHRMVPLNCAVLSENLVEDELFGHEKGAFTGAVARRTGKFEFAHKGTLFLDEIGDLSLRLQAKFLRVLQERTFERLGGNLSIGADFRLISATHRDLGQMTQEGTFREDLMYRIDVVSFHIPPLRERRGDLKLLAGHFLVEFAEVFDRPEPLSFSKEVMAFLHDYHWPGNVRELRHFVERAVALSDGPVIGPEVLPDTFSPVVVGDSLVPGEGTFDTMVKKYKRQLLIEALETTGNKKIQAAQLLGISKSYLFKMIKQLSVPG